MKKQILYATVIISLIISILLGLYTIGTLIPGIYENYSEWKTVTIDECGTFKVPYEWVVSENDGFISFKDKEGNLLMIQTGIRKGFHNESLFFNNNEIEIKISEVISSEVFANSASYGRYNYEISQHQIELFGIDFNGSDSEAYFVILDSSISEKLIRKVAESFVMF